VIEHDVGRLTAFTDGVMAVAITLLVLNIAAPVVHHHTAHALWHALAGLGDDLLAYAIAFALVGRYWVVHHQLFERLRAADGRLLTLNLVFLAFIALMPFSTELLAHYGDLGPGAAVFGATLALAALAHWRMLAHVRKAKLGDELGRDQRSAFVTVVFATSVPVALLSPVAAQVMWLATIFVRYPLRRLGRSSATSE
jgi:uncharacterized membrane protein